MIKTEHYKWGGGEHLVCFDTPDCTNWFVGEERERKRKRKREKERERERKRDRERESVIKCCLSSSSQNCRVQEHVFCD